jgi:hypothetical protein
MDALQSICEENGKFTQYYTRDIIKLMAMMKKVKKREEPKILMEGIVLKSCS